MLSSVLSYFKLFVLHTDKEKRVIVHISAGLCDRIAAVIHLKWPDVRKFVY